MTQAGHPVSENFEIIMSALFLSPPSFDGFDGGAGSRYQARREVTSFWYPTWLAQPAALVPGARLLDHSADAAHHRSVFTIAGAPGPVTRF